MVESALESAISHGNQQIPSAPMADHRRLTATWDVVNQLQRTRQWEAEGTKLLRPADFHAWAAAGRIVPW